MHVSVFLYMTLSITLTINLSKSSTPHHQQPARNDPHQVSHRKSRPSTGVQLHSFSASGGQADGKETMDTEHDCVNNCRRRRHIHVAMAPDKQLSNNKLAIAHGSVDSLTPERRQWNADEEDIDEFRANRQETVRCSTVTVFGLLTVDCSSSQLMSASAAIEHFSQLLPTKVVANVRILRLTDNWLTELDANSFGDHMSTLEQLIVDKNIISYVNDDTFRRLNNLQVLDFSDNRLTSLHNGSFRFLFKLRRISFRGNQLVIIGPMAFRYLENIESIDLSHCQLKHIDHRAFSGCNRLVAINLADNLLIALNQHLSSHLPPQIWNYTSLNLANHLERRGSMGPVVQHTAGLRLDGNPWYCDCRLRWLRRHYPVPVHSANSSPTSDDKKWPTCDKPEVLHDIAWQYLESEQFACPSRIVADDGSMRTGGRNQRKQKPIEIRRGHNATIRCVVIGDPEPRIHWTHTASTSLAHIGSHSSSDPDIQLKDDYSRSEAVRFPVTQTTIRRKYDRKSEYVASQGDFTELKYVSRVHLTAVRASTHAGVYRCTAVNSAGRAEVAYTVTVLEDDHPTTMSRLSTKHRSRRRLVTGWIAIGRSIAVFGMTLVVLMSALVAIIAVRRNRNKRRRRSSEYASTKHRRSHVRLPRKERLRRSDQKCSPRQQESSLQPDEDAAIETSKPKNYAVGLVSVPTDQSPSGTKFHTISVSAVSTSYQKMCYTTHVNKYTRASPLRAIGRRMVSVSSWQLSTLTPVAESPPESSDDRLQLLQRHRPTSDRIFPAKLL